MVRDTLVSCLHLWRPSEGGQRGPRPACVKVKEGGHGGPPLQIGYLTPIRR